MKNALLLAGASALATGLAAAPAAADINLKLSYWVPPTHLLTPGYKEWAKVLSEKTNGSIKVTLYPSSQLGSGRDHYDMVKRGIADIGLINPSYTPGRFPVFDAMNLPFTISNSLRAAPALMRWYSKYAEKEMPDQLVCHVYTHAWATIHTTASAGPVKVPEDVKGLRIRSANHVMSRFITSLGGNPVQVPIMEAKETLKRGITDGITVTFGGIAPHSVFKFGDVTKYTLEMPLYMNGFTEGVNKRALRRMTKAERDAFMSTCTPEWSARVFHYWYEDDLKDQQEARKMKDHVFYKPTAAEVARWKQAAQTVRNEWAADVRKRGYDPDQVISELQSELEKADALF